MKLWPRLSVFYFSQTNLICYLVLLLPYETIKDATFWYFLLGKFNERQIKHWSCFSELHRSKQTDWKWSQKIIFGRHLLENWGKVWFQVVSQKCFWVVVAFTKVQLKEFLCTFCTTQPCFTKHKNSGSSWC